MAIRDWFNRSSVQAASLLRPNPLSRTQAESYKSKSLSWQKEAYRVRKAIGELYFATEFMARVSSRLDWDVTIGGNLVDADEAQTMLDSLHQTEAQPFTTAEIVRQMVVHRQVGGEFFYGEVEERGEDGEPTGQTHWTVVSPIDQKFKKKLASFLAHVRWWNPDPENPGEADSAMRPILPIAYEVIKHQQLATAQTNSRLINSGVLLYPNDVPWEEGVPFDKEFEQAAMASLQLTGDASSIIPMLIGFPGEDIERWRHFKLDIDIDENLQSKLDHGLERIFRSLEIPPEIVKGIADMNHWNAWQLEDQTYTDYLEPMVSPIGRVLGRALAVDLNREEGEVEVRPNPQNILARRSSVSDAFEGWDRAIVSSDYVRRQMGANEDDAPEQEDRDLVERLNARSSRAQDPATNTSPPSLQAAVVSEDQDLEALARQLTHIDIQLRSQVIGMIGQAFSTARRAMDETSPDLAPSLLSDTADSVADTFESVARDAVTAIQQLGAGPELESPHWELSIQSAKERLVEGVTEYFITNAHLPDSEVAALPTNLVREVVDMAGGASSDVTASSNGSRTLTAGGMAVGPITEDHLSNQGIKLVQHRWIYGPGFRTDPFPPHQSADGRFTDFEGTVFVAGAPWNPQSIADHKGCLCDIEPVYRRVNQP